MHLETALLTGALCVLSPAALCAQGGLGQRGPSPLGWRLTLNAGSQAESNARFQESGGAGDMTMRANGELAGTLGGARGRVELIANADLLHYSEFSELDRLNYGFGARGGGTLTPRLTLGGSAYHYSASSLDLGASRVDESGDILLLPFSKSRATVLSSSARYLLSPRMEATAEGSYTKNSFDSRAIVGGTVIVTRMGLRRRYSAEATLGVVGDAAFTSTGGRSIERETLAGEWGAGFGLYQLRVRAGAALMRSTDIEGAVISAAGDAEVRRSSRAGAFGLHYSHGAVEALGLGRALISDAVGVTHERVWWRSLSVRASADQAWLTDPTAPGSRLSTSSVNAEARRSLGRVFWIAAGGFLRRRSQLVAVQNNGVYVNAGFTVQQ